MTSAERARKLFTPLQTCDERMCVNTCVNKSLFQAVESSPHLLFCQPYEIQCQLAYIANAYADWAPKIWCNTQSGYSYATVVTTALFLSQNGLRSNLRESNFKKFPVEACPQTPPSLSCLVMYTHPCNPPSKSLGYRPACTLLVSYQLSNAFGVTCSWRQNWLLFLTN